MNRVQVSRAFRRSGTSAVLGGLLVVLLEAVLSWLNAVEVPDGWKPFLPIVGAILGALLNILRRPTVSVKTLHDAMPEVEVVTHKGAPVPRRPS